MLYLVCFSTEGEERRYREFFDQMDRLGPNRMAFPGCYLLDARCTAQGAASALRPLLPRGGRLLVSRLSRRGEESAGKLSAGTKSWLMGRAVDGPPSLVVS